MFRIETIHLASIRLPFLLAEDRAKVQRFRRDRTYEKIPVLLDSALVLHDGQHRFAAAVADGVEAIPVVIRSSEAALSCSRASDQRWSTMCRR